MEHGREMCNELQSGIPQLLSHLTQSRDFRH